MPVDLVGEIHIHIAADLADGGFTTWKFRINQKCFVPEPVNEEVDDFRNLEEHVL